MSILLVDADIVAYKIAAVSETPIRWENEVWTLHSDETECQRLIVDYFDRLKEINPNYSIYELWLMITQNSFPDKISEKEKEELLAFKNDSKNIKKYQHKETIYRYQKINEILKKTYLVDRSKASDLRAKLDIVTSEFSKEKITILLAERKVKELVVLDFIALLKSCEFARYTPTSDVMMKQDYEKAIEVISNIDKQIQ